MNQWNHKDEWRQNGKDFLVTVTRHSTTPSTIDVYEGPNRWAVYAYIYPKHPLFQKFDGESIGQEVVLSFPLHCGCSFVRSHFNGKQEIMSVQVGADYHHLHDDEFTHFATQDEAQEVFSDAQHLFDYLTRKEGKS